MKERIAPAAETVVDAMMAMMEVPDALAHEEAVMTLGTLAVGLAEDFMEFLPRTMGVVTTCMRNTDHPRVSQSATEALCSVCDAVGPALVEYMDDLLTVIMGNLRDNYLPRTMKPVLCAALGDVATACGPQFVTDAFPVVMSLLHTAAETAANEPEDVEDEDEVEYINLLRKSVLQGYTGVVQGLSDVEEEGENSALVSLQPYIENITEFARYLVELYGEEKPLPTELVTVLPGLVCDVVQAYGAAVLPTINTTTAWVQKVLQEGAAYEDGTTDDAAKFAQDLLEKLESEQYT
jgi:hypothetical protein